MTMHMRDPTAGAAGLDRTSLPGGNGCSSNALEAPAQPEFSCRRRQRLVERLHRLGPKPLFHFLNEVERGADLWPHLERYAALPPEFIKANGGDQFEPFLHVIDGGKP
jgi:hypothetical protein